MNFSYVFGVKGKGKRGYCVCVCVCVCACVCVWGDGGGGGGGGGVCIGHLLVFFGSLLKLTISWFFKILGIFGRYCVRIGVRSFC